jgi:D-3-phosphoglycerate dehydrogenase
VFEPNQPPKFQTASKTEEAQVTKGIVWITTTWVNSLKEAPNLLKPLADEAGLEIRIDSSGVRLSEEEVIQGLPGVVATLPSNDIYNENVFSKAKDLRIVARTGVGLNAIDLDAATAYGVVVTSAAGQNSDSVAEHAFGIMLGAARRIPWMDRNIREGNWAQVRHIASSLKGRTLGLVGLGNIGKEVARRAAAFGMEVLAYDVYQDERFAAEVGVYFHSLEEVARRSDFISCHLPLLPETERIIGPAVLKLMKPTAFLINTSRGPIVDIDALADSLAQNQIRGAAIDVFPEEPPDPSYPLFSLENVVVTPHAAGLGEDACENCLRHAVHAILDLLAGRRPHDVANPSVLKKLGILG